MINIKNEKNQTNVDILECLFCGKDVSLTTNVCYKHNNDGFEREFFPVHKNCIQQYMGNNKDVGYSGKVIDILRMLNRPYIHSSWIKNECNFGKYLKELSLSQNKSLTFRDSEFTNGEINKITNEYSGYVDLDFDVTKEMVLRWGQKYSPEEYNKLEMFYNDMKSKNRIETPQEETYLKKIAVISLKMDIELENGDMDKVKKLGDLLSKYMADSQFRTIDKSEADRTGGLRNFGAIYAEVEQKDHIPPWERFRKIKGLKQDLVDKTIMHIENFTLRLNKIQRMVEPPKDTPKIGDE